MLIAGLAIFLGFVSVFYPSRLNTYLGGAMGLVLVWLGLSFFVSRCSLFRPYFLSLLICLFSGALYGIYTLKEYQTQLINADDEGENRWLEGRIATIPKKPTYGYRFHFTVTNSDLGIKHVILNWYAKKHLSNIPEQGQDWRFLCRLKRPNGIYNSAGFDYEKWLAANDIHAIGYVRQAELLGSKSSIRQKILNQLPLYDHPSAGVVTALSLGVKHGLSEEVKLLFQKTGTAHLFAISGMHIGLIYGMAFFLVRGVLLLGFTLFRARSWGISWVQPATVFHLTALLCAYFYAYLAGFSISTQRACIMLSVASVAFLLKKKALSIQSLMISLVLIILIHPLSVLNSGFWLSYGAVVWIFFIWKLLPNSWSKTIKVLCLQCLLPVAMWPVMKLFFTEVAFLSAISNLIVIPLMSFFIIPLSLFLSLVGIFIDFKWIYPVLDAGLVHGLEGLKWFLNLPELSFLSSANHVILWLIVAILFIFQLSPLRRYFVIPSLSLLTLLSIFPDQTLEIEYGAVSLDFIDVGQGSAVLVRTQSKTLLFDTGVSTASGFNMGKAAIIPLLKSNGTESIDKLILSHGDRDHIGGAVDVVDAIETERILSGEPERTQMMTGLSSELCRDQSWVWDGVEFTLYWFGGFARYANDRSCVLRIKDKKGRQYLLPGDIGFSVESKMLSFPELKGTDVLMAPHHGSKYSSSAEFITHLSPKYVVFTQGYRNRYHFPSPETVLRYQKNNARQLSSSECGLIHIKSTGGVFCSRNHLPWWRRSLRINTDPIESHSESLLQESTNAV